VSKGAPSDRSDPNADAPTVSGFGDEWSAFDQSGLGEAESAEIFGRYFSVLDGLASWRPEHALDVGCGSGRWARHVAPLVGSLTAVDASPAALDVARRNLATFTNVICAVASVADLPVADDSQDLVYSLGVLHHVPDTAAAITSCVVKVKPGGRLLLYLYYRFDDRPRWFRLLWRLSDIGRRLIARLPFAAKRRVTDVIALTVYWPLARTARLLKRRGRNVTTFPLSIYRDSSVYTMRTDALDRFGTRLEQRFTRPEIERMMRAAGLVDIRFRDGEPCWCVVGTKPRP